MNDIVSIITPVYNSEKFLEQCIQSIINQTYPYWQLILVNDGSSDKSGEICKFYEKKDKRINSYHIKNQGVSHARNFGLKMVKGKWIAFIDSDDFVNNTYISNLIMGNTIYDFIVGGYKTFGVITKNIQLSNDNINLDRKNIKKIDVEDNNPNINITYHICGKLYRTNIINSRNIEFPVNMKLAEDTCFNLKYLSHCSSIKTIDDIGYNYRIISYGKHTLDFNKYIIHKNIFNDYIKEFELAHKSNLNIIKRNIERALFESLYEEICKDSNYIVIKNIRKKLKENNIKIHKLFPIRLIKRSFFYLLVFELPYISTFLIKYRMKYRLKQQQ